MVPQPSGDTVAWPTGESLLTPGRPVGGEFLRFSVIGAFGFTVDIGVLYLSLRFLALDPFSGRVVSYVCAATSTWILNRNITFADRVRAGAHMQWLRFLTVNSAGGLLNFAVYSLVVSLTRTTPMFLLLGVALGSLSGLTANFFASRRYVFLQKN